MPKILHIFNDTYTENFYYINVKTHKQFRKVLLDELGYELKEHKNSNGGFIVLEREGGLVGVIWAPRKNIPVLAHECLHAVNWSLSNKGFELTYESEEAYTYYLQFLLRVIINKIDYRNYDKLIKNAQKKQKKRKK